MEKLKTSIKIYGETAKQIKRTKNIAIYQISNTNYEVIVINEAKQSVFKTLKHIEREQYPRQSEWGSLGFTYMSYKKALNKINQLLKK